jgi:hypothetical protein
MVRVLDGLSADGWVAVVTGLDTEIRLNSCAAPALLGCGAANVVMGRSFADGGG